MNTPVSRPWSNVVNCTSAATFVGHVSEEYRGDVDRRLAAAYRMTSTPTARRALEQLHRELQELNPSAARSLAEGVG